MPRSSVLVVVLLAAACSEGTRSAKLPETTPSPPAPSSAPLEAPRPSPAAPPEITVTTKSPEALAAFLKGRDRVDLQRRDGAEEPLRASVTLDPDFALAHAYLSFATPGAEGQVLLEKAVALAAALPEAERLWIEGHLDVRRGQPAEADRKWSRVVELAPGDWRTLRDLGNRAQADGRLEDAIRWFEQAVAAKPDLAVVYNGLAYAYAGLTRWDQATEAARRQTELLPTEANPQDTYGEILLFAGKFDLSERAFQQAATLDPRFDLAWQGVAFARAYRGDWAGAYEATDQQRAAAGRPQDRFGADIDLAWLKFAEGKTDEALAVLDGIERAPEAKPLVVYQYLPVDRGNILYFAGRYAEAAKAFASAPARAATMTAAQQLAVRRRALAAAVSTGALLGKRAAAVKAFAELEALAKGHPESQVLAQLVEAQRGMLAWAQGGPKVAVAKLSTCAGDDFPCRFNLALAQERSGDRAGAQKTREALAAQPRRDHVLLWAHQQWKK